MSVRRALVLVLGSVLLHVTAGAGGLLLASRTGAREPLVVDLTQLEPSTASPESEPRRPALRPPPPRPAPPARGPARLPAREPVAPAPPLEPAATSRASIEMPSPAVPSAPPVEARSDATPAAPSTIAASPAAAEASPSGPGAAPAPEAAPGSAPRYGGVAGASAPPPGGTGAGSGARLALGVPGDGRDGVPAEYTAYLVRFRQQVQQVVSYPFAARRRGLSGTVELEATIDEGGRVRDVRVLSSSSHGILDEAAVEALGRMPPIPFPAHVPPRRLTVRLPLVFDLK